MENRVEAYQRSVVSEDPYAINSGKSSELESLAFETPGKTPTEKSDED